MHSVEIPDIQTTIEFASEISELKPAEYLAFVELMLLFNKNAIDYKTFRIRLAIELLHLHYSKKKLPAATIDQIHENIYRISEYLDSFCRIELLDGSPVRKLEIYFIKQLLPSIELPDGTVLYGPDDALLNIKGLEFKEAHNSFEESEEGTSETALNNLIAVLYRPEVENYTAISQLDGFDGQRRIKFNPWTVLKRAQAISELPFHVKYAVWIWFANCKTFFYEGKPTIDGIEIDLSILYQKSNDDTKPKLGLTDLLFTMAETGLFGNMSNVADQDWYDMLYAMYRSKINYDKLKSKTPGTAT